VSRFASKAAEELAEQLGVIDFDIPGTGARGAVTVGDVRALIPAPPGRLESHGFALWLEMNVECELRPDEGRLLFEACRTLDEVGRMEVALSGVDMVVAGSKGQDRPHPLIGEVRAHRLALKSLLGSIGITDDLLGGEGGGDSERSAAGRNLARKRWDRRGQA
jgi:hypothetical protein